MKNVTDEPPVHASTAHFLPADFENDRFENGTLTGKFLKQLRLNETGRFLGCRYISLGSKACGEFFTVKFPTLFKLCRYCVNAS